MHTYNIVPNLPRLTLLDTYRLTLPVHMWCGVIIPRNLTNNHYKLHLETIYTDRILDQLRNQKQSAAIIVLIQVNIYTSSNASMQAPRNRDVITKTRKHLYKQKFQQQQLVLHLYEQDFRPRNQKQSDVVLLLLITKTRKNLYKQDFKIRNRVMSYCHDTRKHLYKQ